MATLLDTPTLSRRAMFGASALGVAALAVPSFALTSTINRSSFEAALAHYRRAYAATNTASTAYDELEEPEKIKHPRCANRVFWIDFKEMPLDEVRAEFAKHHHGEHYWPRPEMLERQARVDRDVAEIERWQCQVAAAEKPSKDALAVLMAASAAQQEAFEALVATPAPDLRAVAIKFDIALEEAAEVDDVIAIRDDLLRLGAH